MKPLLRVLMVEDSEDDADLMVRTLKKDGLDLKVKRVETGPALQEALAQGPWDVIIADFALPQFNGLEALRLTQQAALDVPFILVSGTVGEDVAVEAMKAGASDYVMKGKLARLAPALRRELREAEERRRRRAAEARMHEEEARFRALTEKSWEGVAVVDADARLVYGSPSTLRLIGYRAEELIGRCLFDLVHEEDRASARAAFAAAMQRPEGTLQREFRVDRRDGAVCWFEFTATNLLAEPGVRGVVINYRDVTDRQAAAEALRESEALFRDTFDEAPVGIALSAIDGPFLRVNHRFSRLLGYTPEELLALGFQDITLPDDLDADLAAGRRLMNGEIATHTRDKRYRRKDGSIVWTNRTISLRRRPDGRPLYFIDVVEDITARKEAETRLALFRALIERSTDAVEVIEPETLRYLDVNESACRRLGYTREELLGLTVYDVDAAIGDPALAYVGQRLRREGSVTFESRHRCRDGTLFPVEVSMAAVQLDRAYVVAVVRDTTERLEAEEALRESEARYRLLFEAAAEGILAADIESRRFRYANPTVCRMFGRSAEEMLRLGVEDLHPAASLPRALAEFEAQARREKVVAYALPCVRKDGSLFYADVKTAVTMLDGRPCAVGFFTDITDRRQAEEALAKERNLLLTLTENIPDLIYFKDRESRFIQINPALARHLGLRSPEEAVGRSDFDFFSEEHARQAFEDEQAILRTGEPMIAKEEKETWADGHVGWAATTKMALRDSAGRIVGTFGVSRDITEHKRAEERIHEQAALLDRANDAIYVTSPDLVIQYWNAAAERIYGWTAAEALGRRTTELIATDHPGSTGLPDDLLAKGDWAGERRQRTKDGGAIEVFCRMTLLRDERRQPRAVLSINTDIREKKQLEAQFLHAQRLESVGALASGIAHDLNNILAPIILSAPLLQGQVSDESARSLLGMIETNAQRGAEIVQQVLAFARGTGGRHTSLQVRHVVAEMVKIAQATFPKSIEVRADIPRELWPVDGDPTQLHQALMNLCVNARDAMPGGGCLEIEATNITVEEKLAGTAPGANAGPYVRLRVRDNGSGIPPDIVDRIFEPFFTTKGVGQGTGLGLATVMSIVRSHDGFVRLDSTVGRGTTFELYLPAKPSAAAPIRPPTREPWPRGNGETVLLVDDEEAVREAVCQSLAAHGYEVATCATGAEAVGTYMESRRTIRLVITDMMMPEMDGPMLVTALRAIDPAVPIVGITGVSDVSSLDQLKALGLSAVLCKPFSIGDLLSAVNEAVKHVVRTEDRSTVPPQSPCTDG